MGLLKIPGLASGLDTDNLIKTLMTLEKRPLTALTQKRDTQTNQANAWRDLNQRVMTLQKRIEELSNLAASDYSARKSSSSDTSLLSISESRSTAQVGSYSVEVTTLATATAWQSGLMVDGGGVAKPVSDPDADLGVAGTIKVSGGPKDGKTFTVTATDSLNDIVKTINEKSAELGFTASVSQVNPGDYRLVLKGNTGAANDFALVDDGGTVAAGLKLTSADATKVATAANGSMKVNGSTISFAENTVKDAVGGLTLTVSKTGTATVTISKDNAKVIDAVKKVVDQYNTVLDFINEKTSYNSETKTAGTLFGDARVNDLRDGIRRVLIEPVEGQTAAYDSLGIVGISSQGYTKGSAYTGKLSVDQDKLAKALEANPNALRDLFTINDGDKQGVAVRARTYLDNYTKTGGILQGRADALDKGVQLLKDQIKRWEEQILPKREERLRAQFLNLEKSMSTLQNQGNWMSQQIKSLGNPNSQ
ncbi:MAG: flagellar hook-associated 2 domain protein [Symbiobacteriaceae bacterium]|jgi:flagellar hook-associated protein 2|nr:flagellar hook-associated 2 domain protein [Symbiobacteriaceae bacterium]